MSATQLSVSNRFHSTIRCTRRYSIHITRHVPKYIIVCTHLSINCTPSSGVCGGVQKHSTQIRAIHRQDNGYFFNNRLIVYSFKLSASFFFCVCKGIKSFRYPCFYSLTISEMYVYTQDSIWKKRRNGEGVCTEREGYSKRIPYSFATHEILPTFLPSKKTYYLRVGRVFYP